MTTTLGFTDYRGSELKGMDHNELARVVGEVALSGQADSDIVDDLYSLIEDIREEEKATSSSRNQVRRRRSR